MGPGTAIVIGGMAAAIVFSAAVTDRPLEAVVIIFQKLSIAKDRNSRIPPETTTTDSPPHPAGPT